MNWRSVPAATTSAPSSTVDSVASVATPIASEPATPTDAASPTPEVDWVASVAVGPLSGFVASTTTPPTALRVALPRRARVVTLARLTATATPTPEPPEATVVPSAVDELLPFDPAWTF